jgi:hypothetical protein
MDEDTIRERLMLFIRHLVELALAVLLLLRSTPAVVNVTMVWQLEVWWYRELPRVLADTRLSQEAAARLEHALGGLAARLDTVAAAGATPSQIRDEVLRFRGEWEGWARRVAITESTRMASEAVLASPAASAPGARKVWESTLDEKVRSSHREADGMTVPLAGSFMFNSGPMRYPGDPMGPPEEVVNCRCGIKIEGSPR